MMRGERATQNPTRNTGFAHEGKGGEVCVVRGREILKGNRANRSVRNERGGGGGREREREGGDTHAQTAGKLNTSPHTHGFRTLTVLSSSIPHPSPGTNDAPP
jgi:hypothetical protein